MCLGRIGLPSLCAQIIEPVPYNVAIFAPAVALGVIGGVLGAVFTRLNNAVNLTRKRIVAAVSNPHAKRVLRIVEAVVFVVSPSSGDFLGGLSPSSGVISSGVLSPSSGAITSGV